jgi:hypothetical protein
VVARPGQHTTPAKETHVASKLPDRPSTTTQPNLDTLRQRLADLRADRADKAAKAGSN